MSRILNEYVTAFRDEPEFKKYLADTSFTSASTEVGITANQYFVKFNDYIVMESDGTKRCGFYVDLTNKILHGDFVEISLEMRSLSGEKPFMVYEEWEGSNSTQFGKKVVESTNHFEIMYNKQYIPNRYGTYKGRVFVGLDIGQVGKFAFRFPTVTHHAQIKYSPEKMISNVKMFQLSKASGVWSVDASTSYRRLEGATLSFGSYSMYISPTKPFIQDVPQVFCMTNKTFAGWVVHFGYRAKDSIELTVYDPTGAPKTWNEVQDGAVLNIMAIAGLYY